MSFLIDGPWLYANGRAIARATDNPAPLAAGTMAVFWGVCIPHVPQPALDAPDLARLPRRRAAATG